MPSDDTHIEMATLPYTIQGKTLILDKNNSTLAMF